MLKIQSSKKFILALLTFSSITASTIFSANANISGSHSGLYSQNQFATVKISQNDTIDLSNGYFTPDQEVKMAVFAREFNEKLNALQQQHSGNPASKQQVLTITKEYFLSIMSVMTPTQREKFKKAVIGDKTMRELGLN
jgi:hypothetical protein